MNTLAKIVLSLLAAGPFKDQRVRIRKSGGADTDLDTLLAALATAAPSGAATP